MLHLFRRHRPALFNLDPDEMANLPSARLVRLLLHQAIEAGASEIAFGVPAGATWDWTRARAEEAANAPAVAAWEKQVGLERTEWLEKSCRLKGAGGLNYIPTWIRVGERYYQTQSLPGPLLPSLLWVVDFIVVALDGTEDHPAPKRYIEVQDFGTGRYAEVELVMGEDNALRLLILGTREAEKGHKP